MSRIKRVSPIRRQRCLTLAIITLLSITISLLWPGSIQATRSDHLRSVAETTIMPDHIGAAPASVAAQADMVAFLDSFFQEKMAAYHVPGAAVVLVQGNEVLFLAGYGYADLEQQIAVDPAQTVFRIGSVSKLFTATALMQLIEQGQIDRHEDVNRYLRRFQLPDTYPQPVTAAHLLTHTGGFDESEIGLTYDDPADAIPLADFLTDHMVPRIRPPGVLNSYSNHGFGLMGLLVEEVAGIPFAHYVEENILAPLGMTDSSFDQAPHLLTHLATGYIYTNGTYQALPHDHLHLPPAGTMLATAADMAPFMIAHLNNGRYEDATILTADTAAMMHAQQFTHHPQLPGYAYGFYERFRNGMRTIEHGGNYYGFMANMVLVPEHDLGLFYVDNQNDRQLWHELADSFLDTAFPPVEARDVLEPPVVAPDYYRQLAGSYRHTRHAHLSLEKIQQLGRESRLSFTDDNVLLLHPPPGTAGEPTRWIEVSPLLFRAEAHEEYLAFRLAEQGHEPVHLLLGTTGHSGAMAKLAWYETSVIHLLVIGLAALVSLIVGILWPLVRLVRRAAGRTVTEVHGAWRLAMAVGLLNLVFLASFLVLIAATTMAGFPPALPLVLFLSLIAAVMTAVLVAVTILAWFRSGQWQWGIGQRLAYTLFTLTSVAFIWSLHYWNILPIG